MMYNRRNVKDRGIVDELQTEFSPDTFEGSLGGLRTMIDDWIKRYGVDARVTWDPYHHIPYDHNPSPMYNIYKQRDETDEEWNKRLHDREMQEMAQHERNLAEYERLQKLLGKA